MLFAADPAGAEGPPALALTPAAHEQLARAYEFGVVRPRDYRLAWKHYQVSADADRSVGQRGAVRMARYLGPFAWVAPGAGEVAADEAIDRQDYADAWAPLTKAAAEGSATAAFVLGSMYEQGIGVMEDVRKAAELYRRAADQLFAPAEFFCAKLAECAVSLGLDGESAWLRRAAAHGYPPAEGLVGVWLIDGGQGEQKDPAGGLALIRRGAGAQDTLAKAILARYYNVGLPGLLEADKNRALTLAAEVRADGNPTATDLLKQIH